MTETQEKLVLDGLGLNEGNFALEGFKFTPGKKQPQWIENPDADGAALAYEPRYSNGEFDLQIRIVPQVDMNTALARWGELQAKLQKASLMREKGGISMPWTPAGSSRTYTAWIVLGEISELPISPEGDLAGWFINAPVVQVKLISRPFLYKEERVLKTLTASGEVPLQELLLAGVGGDVPAEARLVVTEASAKDRRHIEWGLDQDEHACLLAAASFTTAGYSGTLETNGGAHRAEIAGAYPAATEAAICCNRIVGNWLTQFSTGNLSHVGSFRVKARVKALTALSRFRISYRVGGGPWKTLKGTYASVAPSVVSSSVWCEVDLGEVTFDEVAKGTQRAEIRLQARSTGAKTEAFVNYLELIPTTLGYGVARGTQSNEPTQLLGYDEFEQAEGNLEGKEAPLGGKWEEAGKTGENGFKVIVASHNAQRAKVSDASLAAGCFAFLPTKYTTSTISAYLAATFASTPEENQTGLGVFLRYVNATNWFMALLRIPGGSFSYTHFRVTKCVGGVETVLEEAFSAFTRHPVTQIPPTKVTLTALSNGSWTAICGEASLSGQDPDLAAGGALAEGKGGFYDVWTSASAATRTVDNVVLMGADEAGRVCFSGRKVEVRSDAIERQDSTGTYYGRPSTDRGDRLYIPTGSSRLALKLRRNDVEVEADNNVTDKHEAEVLITERVLAPV